MLDPLSLGSGDPWMGQYGEQIMNETYTEQRYVPRRLSGQRVVKVETIPPGQRGEGDAPIARELILVKVHLQDGGMRYYGTTHAHIDASLRMVIAINPQDEVLRTWEQVRTDSKPRLIIEICPHEAVADASACLPNGKPVSDDPDITEALADCCRSGDCQPACEYVRDVVGVEFRIVVRNAKGEYVNRLATAEEKAKTARAIYFDSEAEFDDEPTAEMYLIWEAASREEQDEDED